MDTPSTTPMPTSADRSDRLADLDEELRDAAYEAWSQSREPEQDRSRGLFDRAYLGQYSTIEAFVDGLIDNYQLDARLDAAIVEPFRRHVDIDVTSMAQALVDNGTLYAIAAIPVGVWVFNGEIE